MKITKVISSIKVLFVSISAFSILCSCTLINLRDDMGPLVGNGWEVKSSQATLSGWSSLDISTFDNNYTQASYQCEDYTIFLNSILDKSYSVSFYPPVFPIYIKTNDEMSLYMLPQDRSSTIVNAALDCPELFSISEKNMKLDTLSGDNNLCRYEFGNDQLDSDTLKLSLSDKKHNCEINDLEFTKTSNWTFCLYCFFNVATQPVYNYQSSNNENEDGLSEPIETSNVNINSHTSTGTRLGATFTGALVGGLVGMTVFSETCKSGGNKCKWSALGGFFAGMYAGGIIGISLADDRTGANVNVIYPF